MRLSGGTTEITVDGLNTQRRNDMRTELQNAMANLVAWHLDYTCTDEQAEYLDYRYTYSQLKRILGDMDVSDWDGRKERRFLGELKKH